MTKQANPFLKVNDELGLVFGFGIVCKVNGVDYYDTQGDHIPEASMLKESMDYMQNSRMSKDMHVGESVQETVFGMPITGDVAKTFGFDSSITGFMAAIKPTPEILEKYKDGTYTGFSIGGTRGIDEDIEGNVIASKNADAAFWKSPGPEFEGAVAKKTIMRTFKFKELSTVDRPAQEPAVVALIKNAKGTLGDMAPLATDKEFLGELAKLATLTSITDKHQHGFGLHSYVLEEGGGSTSYDGGTPESSHSHPCTINDDGSVTVGMVQGHTHELDMFAAVQRLRIVMSFDKKALDKKPNVGETPIIKAADFALIPDANRPETWKLQIRDSGAAKANRRRVAQVVADISKNRCRYLRALSDSDRVTVIRRCRKGWQEANPSKPTSTMPSVLKQALS